MFVLTSLAAVACIGAILGLLVGWPFHFIGAGWMWAAGGVAASFVAFAAFIAWRMLKDGGNIIASTLLACALAVLMASPQPASAGDLVLSNATTGASIRLAEGPCTDAATLAQIKDEVAPQFKAARAIIDGKSFAGCWTEDAGRVVLFFENGERFLVPASKFRDPMV